MSALASMQATLLQDIHQLLSPITAEHFIQEYWEKKPLIVHRNDPNFYQSLFSIDMVDHVLDASRPRGGSLRVVKDQQPMLPGKYENADGSLNLNQLYVAYANGYTLVINEMERFWKPLRTLCQNVTAHMSHHTMGNMYLTPKNGKALLPHYDTHDVYVLQVHGKKHWRIYDMPMETPLLNSHQPIFQREQLRNPQEITLNAGDLMYMPRGLPHEAYTTDESSLHITIGVYPAQWLDLIQKSIQQLANSEPALRKALPAGYLKAETWTREFQQEFLQHFSTIMAQVAKKARANDSLMLLSEDKRNKEQTNADGHFRQLDRIEELQLSSKIAKRQGVSCTTQTMGNFSRILFTGNIVKGPAHIAEALDFITQASGSFAVGDIPGLSDNNKIKLTARLIRGGLLRFTA